MAITEMEDNLFPDDIDTVDEDLLQGIEDSSLKGYKKGLYFDMEQGDLLLNGSGQILTANEFQVWSTWCQKIISTPRYACDLYSTDIGIDVEKVFAAEDREEAESILESEINEALIVDPYGRTMYVQSVLFEWLSDDSIAVEVTVVGVENEILTVNTVITAA